MRNIATVLAVTLLLAVSDSANANCRAEIEGNLPNQIGHIVLFSSRGKGPAHPLFESEFWAITGPSDHYQLMAYPVRFSADLQETVDSWDWQNNATSPRILRVLVDGVVDGDMIWLEVREILDTKSSYEQALARYPDARFGTCGSYFGSR